MASSSSDERPTDPLPSQLLHYLPSHKAVVCTTCHYAIQPTAVSRHIKDIHLIHRSRRRPFMSFVSTLDLASPEQVVQTQAKLNVFPVPGLPVLDGLMCNYVGCGHLCVSTKRMRSHWMGVHGAAGRVGQDWKPARLQTFFKGNLLKYFTDGSDYTEAFTPSPDYQDIEISDDGDKMYIDKTAHQVTSPQIPPYYQNLVATSETSLLNHFITNTALSLSTDPEVIPLWQATIPSLAVSQTFLYHGILTCSALHLAYLNPTSRQCFTFLASHHQDLAMPLFRQTMTAVTPENCDAVLAFAHLLVIISFANSSNDEDLLLVSPPAFPMPISIVNGGSNPPQATTESILPPWLYLLRTGCSILCEIWDLLENGPVQALARQWEIPIAVDEDTPSPMLTHLLALIPTYPAWTDEEVKIYTGTAVELDLAYRYKEVYGEKFTNWDALRVWPIAISDEYTEMLARQHPGALVLLGFYCVMLKMMEVHWSFEGRATRLLRAVLTCLNNEPDAEKWIEALNWPIVEVGIENAAQKDAPWKGGFISMAGDPKALWANPQLMSKDLTKRKIWMEE